MIHFFSKNDLFFVAETSGQLSQNDIEKLIWLFGEAQILTQKSLDGFFIGPRKEMITPWSTNAVEITQNMGIEGIKRIEQFFRTKDENTVFDPMLSALYKGLDDQIFTILKTADPINFIENITAYNQKEGLALSAEEVEYLENLSKRLGRQLTDGEVYGFAQVNSEHCRHKIFNGTFVIDGNEMPREPVFTHQKNFKGKSQQNCFGLQR